MRSSHKLADWEEDDFTVRNQSELAAAAQSTTEVMTLLLAAIEAVPGIHPQDAAGILSDLTGHEDEDISEAAYEAIAMAEALLELEDGDDDEDDSLLD